MFNALTWILFSLAILYLIFIIAEHFYYSAKRKKIKLLIHVNGIRGKSTVTRLIYAGLKECGYSVFCKTTGTVPTKIGVDGVPVPIKRLGPANIREQNRVLRWAVKEKAEALVVECMAVSPELQYLTENRILHSDISVITNVRPDHLDMMGDTPESIAYSLANTTPEKGTVILGEDKFTSCFKECADKRGSKLFVAAPYEGEELLDTFPENIATALGVCDVLNLDREKYFNGMRNYIHDIGALSVIKLDDTIFINGFSINDPQSTLEVYQKVKEKFGDDIIVLLNARPDRPFRVNQHIEMIRSMTFSKLMLTGSSTEYINRKLKNYGLKGVKINKPEELLGKHVIFGCGNIAGNGMKILNYFRQNGEENYL